MQEGASYPLILITLGGKYHRSVPSPRGLLTEHSRATGSNTWDPEALPYLEGLISPPGGSFDSDGDPDSTTSSSSDSGNTPDGTSSSSLSVVSRASGGCEC